ncbi:oligoendopeptidase F [Geomicrobium sp. JSM 1781026]|uniref:oligoendopeptidase F n=1 Tax=Geomicrobium sp. JSM 1781026 TaxID=3344580 RepID=UPI0035C1565D
MTQAIQQYRQDVRTEETWDLTDLFASDKSWEKAYEELETILPRLKPYQGTLHESAKQLLDCLKTYENMMQMLIPVATYAMLKVAADGSDANNQSRQGKVSQLQAAFSRASAFINSEIVKIDDETLHQFFNENDELHTYEVQIQKIRKNKDYMLSDETEEVLAALNESLRAPFSIYKQGKAADLSFADFQDDKGNTHPLTFALFEDKYEFSKDASIRRNAYKTFIDGLSNYQHTFAGTYAAEVTRQVNVSRLRGYPSVTDMLLHEQDVEPAMYHRQIDTIYNELSPYMQRYATLKKNVLGLDELTFADLKAPLDPDYDPEISFEEAFSLIKDSLKVMGEDYNKMIDRAYEERWVDRAENVGKQNGAFCASPYGAHPYILMTWTNMMRGTFILTHELGHAGHFYTAHQHQKLGSARPSTYMIEAPSTMNEMLLGDHLLKTADSKEMKRWVVLSLLGTYYHNFVTHLLEAHFQREVYQAAEEGTILTADKLNELKLATLQGFWGDTVTFDKGAALTWMRQPHYYMGLYPYTYSAGLTASTYASRRIIEEGAPAVERWLDMLRAGGSKSPLELLSIAGVDLSTAEPISEAVNYVGSLVQQLEESYA